MTDKELQEIREWIEGHPSGHVMDWMETCRDNIHILLDEIDRLKGEAVNTEARIMVQSVDSDILADEIKRLYAQRTWISVKDRMPDGTNLDVLTIRIPGGVMVARSGSVRVRPYDFSHWMPFPPIPPR